MRYAAAMDEEREEGWYRRKVGRRLERALNRLVAGVLGAVGFVAGYTSLPTDEHDIRWIGMGIAVALFWLAGKCWRARRAVIEIGE
ncbi:hypothetical protein GCM10010990_19110 [Croceicoccus mobilis]|uniref:Uncharacterized protein n=2 Tax=Croceicoccus mobilis TaxID=1703339 RepID=A0A916Z0K3_9SPHN|nr:hypothetical protein GCM10010990_19110 [Croceicoccus mobilis]